MDCWIVWAVLLMPEHTAFCAVFICPSLHDYSVFFVLFSAEEVWELLSDHLKRGLHFQLRVHRGMTSRAANLG